MRAGVPRRVGGAAQRRRPAPSTVVVGDEHAGLAVDDRFERAAAAERHHRPAAGLRLDRHDAEVFFARQQHGGRACGSSSRTASSVEPAEQLARRRPAASASSARAFRAVADDVERHAGAACAAVDGQIEAFVGHQGRHDRRKSASRDGASSAGREELGIDRRIHNGRLTIIVQRDPPRNILRNSEIAVYAAGRGAVPAGQSRPAPAAAARWPARPTRSGPK